MPALIDNLNQTLVNYTAGDPCQENVIWTCLSVPEIARMLGKLGTPVSEDTIRDMLKSSGFSRRKPEKRKTMGQCQFRNEQFENIADWRATFEACDNPIISMDTKKKELLGELCRTGMRWANGPNETYDHDYPSSAEGLIIPHGLYDVQRNQGHITLGTSHDTSEFACDSFYLWWTRHGQYAWPDATSILLLCDGGGSNNSRHYIFKEDLQNLADRIGLPIRVAHYPPHCSKYNLIEHRLFCHVTRAWSGIVFRAMKIVKDCLRRVWTSSGLKVTHAVLDKTYELGRKASGMFLESYPILHDEWLPNWNYLALPRQP